MKKWLVIGVVLAAVSLSSQGKRVIVVQPFTLAAGVELPYDMKLLQPQLVADLKVQIGKEFDVVVGSSRVDLQACKLEYSIVSPK